MTISRVKVPVHVLILYLTFLMTNCCDHLVRRELRQEREQRNVKLVSENITSSAANATAMPSFEEDEDDISDIDYENISPNKPERLVNKKGFPYQVDDLFEDEINLTVMHEEAKYFRINQIKDAILSKLRISVLPNMTILSKKIGRYPHHILPTPALIPDDQLLQMDSSEQEDEFHAKISTVIQFASSIPPNKTAKISHPQSAIYFPLPLSVSARNLDKAVMLVYLQTPVGVTDKRTAQLIIKSNLRRKKPLVQRTVALRPGGHWEHMDITDEVKTWAADEDEYNYGLTVTARYEGENIAITSTDEQSSDFPGRVPLVKLTLNDQQSSRYRRSLDEYPPLSCNPEDQEKRCCRYKFVMDFDEFGHQYDFIITPRRYLANYCAGHCEAYHLPSSLTDQVAMGLSRNRKWERCCTPDKLEPLEMLYMDDAGSINFGSIPGMTIEKCGCS